MRGGSYWIDCNESKLRCCETFSSGAQTYGAGGGFLSKKPDPNFVVGSL